jgi:hypothetical protein
MVGPKNVVCQALAHIVSNKTMRSPFVPCIKNSTRGRASHYVVYISQYNAIGADKAHYVVIFQFPYVEFNKKAYI